jgi:hypothetical protein
MHLAFFGKRDYPVLRTSNIIDLGHDIVGGVIYLDFVLAKNLFRGPNEPYLVSYS